MQSLSLIIVLVTVAVAVATNTAIRAVDTKMRQKALSSVASAAKKAANSLNSLKDIDLQGDGDYFAMYTYTGSTCTDGSPAGYTGALFGSSGTCDDNGDGTSMKTTCSSDGTTVTLDYYSGDTACATTATNFFTNQPVNTCIDVVGVKFMGQCSATSLAPTADDDDAVCFAGSETLLLESGASISMENVKVGDRVQVASADGSLDFADVIFLPHEKNVQRSAFVEIETSNGSLKATPTHLVMAGECGGDMTLTRAEDVNVGFCMASVSGEEAVIASTTTFSSGVYSVITSHPDGIIVVNGFKASSFALNHAVGNTYYHIHRVLYAVAPGVVQALSGIGAFLGSIAISVSSA